MANVTCKRLDLKEVLLIVPRTFEDERGAFVETYSAKFYTEFGIDCAFVQGNQSVSLKRGTVRGLHFQAPPSAQAKLIRVSQGSIFDVAVDVRRNSPTFGQWCGATLTAKGAEQLFIPRGFAHGFCTLEDVTTVAYSVDAYYDQPSEGGVIWNDPDLGIRWPIGQAEAILSQKDAELPRLKDLQTPFVFQG